MHAKGMTIIVYILFLHLFLICRLDVLFVLFTDPDYVLLHFDK